MTTEEILAERQKTHGDFAMNAEIAQNIRLLYRNTGVFYRLAAIEREAFDMMAVKMARILCGKSMCRQHWEDLAGYPTLVVNACDEPWYEAYR